MILFTLVLLRVWNTHRVHTLRWPPPSLCAQLPAPSARRNTATPRSAQTHCSGWDGIRRCRRTHLNYRKKRVIKKQQEAGKRGKYQGGFYEVVTSSLSQFQRLPAVVQTSSCDHKLHHNNLFLLHTKWWHLKGFFRVTNIKTLPPRQQLWWLLLLQFLPLGGL